MSTTYTHHSPHHSTETRQTMTNTTAVKRTTAPAGTAVKNLIPGDMFNHHGTTYRVVSVKATRAGHSKGFTTVTMVSMETDLTIDLTIDSGYRVYVGWNENERQAAEAAEAEAAEAEAKETTATVPASLIEPNDLIAVGDVAPAIPAEYDLTNIAYAHVWEVRRRNDSNEIVLLIALPAIFEHVSVTIPSDVRVTIKR